MRFLSLRAVFLLGFVVAMPVLALPPVARRIDEQIARFRVVMDRDLPALNDQISQARIPVIAPIPRQEVREREPAGVAEE